MSTKNTNEKTDLKLLELPIDTTKNDIESFLSQYKDKIKDISIEENKSTSKEFKKRAKVSFKDNQSANECKTNMNLKKIKNSSIRIMWDEKDYNYKNFNKNNLYIKGIPQTKTAREIFEYFNKFGDIYSIKINENESGKIVGTGYINYYKEEDAKKAIDETNGKKIFDSNIELNYHPQRNERNFHHYNENLKININNMPDTFTNNDLQKLCEEYGKIQSAKIFNGPYGKYGIVIFSSEQEAKNAIEKLNNKEINGKKLIVNEPQRRSNYQPNNNNYYNKQFPIYEDSFENSNLYIKNIPLNVKEEDLKKVFEPFGNIKSIKLDTESRDIKEKNGEIKKQITNKGYGYISFDNSKSAKQALESLNDKFMPGFPGWSKPLSINFFVSRQKRQMIDNASAPPINFIGGNPGIMYTPYPVYSPQFPPQMMRMPFSNPINMIHPGNYKNRGYNGLYRPKFKKGGYKGGYHKSNNHQRKKNNLNNQNQENTNNSENTAKIEENKTIFNHEAYNKITDPNEKKDFLGEILFNAIQENPNIVEKGIGIDIVGKITGMIIEIPEQEIIEILEKPEILNSRILEALALLNNNK